MRTTKLYSSDSDMKWGGYCLTLKFYKNKKHQSYDHVWEVTDSGRVVGRFFSEEEQGRWWVKTYIPSNRTARHMNSGVWEIPGEKNEG